MTASPGLATSGLEPVTGELIGVPPGTAPIQYQLAPGEALTVESASATFDGSAAAGAFLPCIAFYAPSGELLSRTFPVDSIAAGASAEVTFAPF